MLAASGEAGAYVREQARESGQKLRLASDRTVLTLSSALPSLDLPEAAVRDALESVARQWSRSGNPCASLEIAVSPAAQPSSVAKDGMSSLVFHETSWCQNGNRDNGCYPESMMAITTLYVEADPENPGRSVIREADIEVNAVGYVWSVDGENLDRARSLRRDLETTLLHELGHVIGLAHS